MMGLYWLSSALLVGQGKAAAMVSSLTWLGVMYVRSTYTRSSVACVE